VRQHRGSRVVWVDLAEECVAPHQAAQLEFDLGLGLAPAEAAHAEVAGVGERATHGVKVKGFYPRRQSGKDISDYVGLCVHLGSRLSIRAQSLSVRRGLVTGTALAPQRRSTCRRCALQWQLDTEGTFTYPV